MEHAAVPSMSREQIMEGWVSAYAGAILKTCFLYLADHDLAQDAMQDTFLKAYRNMDSFRGKSSEKTWLIRIAINCCRDTRRSLWYRYIDPRISVDQLPLSSAPPSDEHLALTMAVMKLKPKYMEAVLLYFYEGYPMKDIASMLNITEAAVSTRIRKAKQKLETELEGGEGDEK